MLGKRSNYWWMPVALKTAGCECCIIVGQLAAEKNMMGLFVKK